MRGSMSATKEKANTGFEFPALLRVLVVDDGQTSLNIVAKMLRVCKYEVTKCSTAKEALSILREGRNTFDIVICDVNMLDMDELFQIISVEVDLPLFMTSSDDKNDEVMKGIIDGASHYLIKPIRMEAINYIWMHVIRKQTDNLKALKQSKNAENSEILNRKLWDSESHLTSGDNENGGSSSCGKVEEEEEEEEEEGKEQVESVPLKKPRMVWTAELHKQFVAAVEEIGIDNAAPKKILEAMNVPTLSRENVASHLQKYRKHIRKTEEDSPHHQNNFTHLPSHSREVNPELVSSFRDYNLQRQVVSAQPQFQSLPIQRQVSDPVFAGGDIPLAEQRNFCGFGFPRPRFVNFESQQEINRTQGSDFCSRVLMESNDLIPLNQFGNEFQGNSATSFAMERPLKMERLDENARNAILNNGEMCNYVSLSSAAVDFPKLSENCVCPQNRVLHWGNGNLGYNPNPSYEPALFGELFDQDDFNIRLFDEQFGVGAPQGRFYFDG